MGVCVWLRGWKFSAKPGDKLHRHTHWWDKHDPEPPSSVSLTPPAPQHLQPSTVNQVWSLRLIITHLLDVIPCAGRRHFMTVYTCHGLTNPPPASVQTNNTSLMHPSYHCGHYTVCYFCIRSMSLSWLSCQPMIYYTICSVTLLSSAETKQTFIHLVFFCLC